VAGRLLAVGGLRSESQCPCNNPGLGEGKSRLARLSGSAGSAAHSSHEAKSRGGRERSRVYRTCH
jgi:hypothetical protein